MAVTITHVKSNVLGGSFEHTVDIAGPATYTAGGEALTAAQVTQLMPRLGSPLLTTDLAKVQYFQSERSTTGVQAILDRTNAKMMFWAQAAEATAGAANLTFRCIVRYGAVGD